MGDIYTHGTKEFQTTIQVQKGVPLDLLLRTDVVAELGLHVIDDTGHGPMIELLQGKMWEPRDDLPKSQLRGDAYTFIPLQAGFVIKVAGVQETTTERAPATCFPAAVTSSSITITVKLLQILLLPARHTKVIKVQPSSHIDTRRKSLSLIQYPRVEEIWNPDEAVDSEIL